MDKVVNLGRVVGEDATINGITNLQIDASKGVKGTQEGDVYKISLDTDEVPTQNSTKALNSGAIYTALSNKADNTDIPTKTSDLTNDSGYITASANVASANYATSAGSASEAAHATSADSATNATNANYANTAGNVPTKLSQLENDGIFPRVLTWKTFSEIVRPGVTGFTILDGQRFPSKLKVINITITNDANSMFNVAAYVANWYWKGNSTDGYTLAVDLVKQPGKDDSNYTSYREGAMYGYTIYILYV